MVPAMVVARSTPSLSPVVSDLRPLTIHRAALGPPWLHLVGDGQGTQAEPVTEGESRAPEEVAARLLSADEWAAQQFAQVCLGDQRLTQRAVEMAAKMAAHPEASLPNQMEGRNALTAAYGVLNNPKVTMEALLAPHCHQTLEEARRLPLVLMTEDTTELDYTAHRCTTGLGPIGDGKGRGVLLHDTLAVVPEGRQVLGLAHLQEVLRQPKAEQPPDWSDSPEGRLWESSAWAVGSPPQGVIWVHVSDRGSDDFGYMAACLDLGKHFLIRAKANRVLSWEKGTPQAEDQGSHHLLDYARSLTPCQDPRASYTVQVPAHEKKPAREAQVVMAWAPQVRIPAPSKVPGQLRHHQGLAVSLLRVWEPNAPPGVDPVEWILISSLPITTVEEALRAVDWYTCRWLCEDYHMCLKTGCRVEHTQLDDAADLRRLLGFLSTIAVRLLQIRQCVRHTPELPAKAVVEPLMVEVLARRQKKDAEAMTVSEFWRSMAQLGGHQGRRSDGPPGWRTLWKGWRLLADMTEGARLFPHGYYHSERCM